MSETKPAEIPANCSYCTGPVDREFGPRCPECSTFQHRECWLEFGGCTTYGCPESPDMKASIHGGASNG